MIIAALEALLEQDARDDRVDHHHRREQRRAERRGRERECRKEDDVPKEVSEQAAKPDDVDEAAGVGACTGVSRLYPMRVCLHAFREHAPEAAAFT